MDAKVQLVTKVLSQIESSFVETFGFNESLSIYDYMLTRYYTTEYNALLKDIEEDLNFLNLKTFLNLGTSPTTDLLTKSRYFIVGESRQEKTVDLDTFIILDENLFTDKTLTLTSPPEQPVVTVPVQNFVNIVKAIVKYRSVFSRVIELKIRITPELENSLAEISRDKLGLYYKLEEIELSIQPKTEANFEENFDDFLSSLDQHLQDQPLQDQPLQPSVPDKATKYDFYEELDELLETSKYIPSSVESPTSGYYYYDEANDGKCLEVPEKVREIFPNMFATEFDCIVAKNLMPSPLVNIVDCTRFIKFKTEENKKIDTNTVLFKKLIRMFKTYEFDDVSTPTEVEGLYVSAILSLLQIFNSSIKDNFIEKSLTLQISIDDIALNKYLQQVSNILQTHLFVWNYDSYFETLFFVKYVPESITSLTQLINVPLCLFQLDSTKAVIPLVPVTLYELY